MRLMLLNCYISLGMCSHFLLKLFVCYWTWKIHSHSLSFTVKTRNTESIHIQKLMKFQIWKLLFLPFSLKKHNRKIGSKEYIFYESHFQHIFKVLFINLVLIFYVEFHDIIHHLCVYCMQWTCNWGFPSFIFLKWLF